VDNVPPASVKFDDRIWGFW